MLTRRTFLKAVAASVAGAAGGVLAAPAESVAFASWPLWLRRNGEEFRFDAATTDGFAAARYLMRDIRAGGVVGYPHLVLLQLLSNAQSIFAAYGVHAAFDVTSGLRLPSTNAATEGAARASFHLPDPNGWFFAADIRPDKIDVEKAAGWFRYVGIGGIGLYPDRGFLHVDVGPARTWRRS